MTVTSILIFLVVFAVIAYLAYWIVTSFFPEPARTPALAIIGILLLLVLLSQVFPGAAEYRIWR